VAGSWRCDPSTGMRLRGALRRGGDCKAIAGLVGTEQLHDWQRAASMAAASLGDSTRGKIRGVRRLPLGRSWLGGSAERGGTSCRVRGVGGPAETARAGCAAPRSASSSRLCRRLLLPRPQGPLAILQGEAGFLGWLQAAAVFVAGGMLIN